MPVNSASNLPALSRSHHPLTAACRCERCLAAPATGRWHRSEQGIVLDVDPPRVAPSDMEAWLHEARPEEELSLDRSVSVMLEWSAAHVITVVNAEVQGAPNIAGPGVYAIYNPDKSLRYIGMSKDMDTRFKDGRYRVLRELGVPNFSFTVYTATATVHPRDVEVKIKSGGVLRGAAAACRLAEIALLTKLPGLPGNRQPPEPVYRDAKASGADIRLNLVSKKAPEPVLSRITIPIFAKPAKARARSTRGVHKTP